MPTPPSLPEHREAYRTVQPTRRPAGLALACGVLLVAATAAATLFPRLGEPAQPVWDESYYLTAIARYELGYASFASHPPLGIVLMAAGDRAMGGQRTGDLVALARVKTVGALTAPPALDYFRVRVASALAGVLAAVLFFLLASDLAGDVLIGAAMAALFVFDTALLAQFRAAQLDSFQLCFAGAAMLCLAKAHRRGTAPARWLAAFGVACGFAAMVRANGLLLLVLGAPLVLAALAGDAPPRRRLGSLAGRSLAVAVGAVAAIAAVAAVHLTVAARPMPVDWPAARADAPYVEGAYRAWLDGDAPASTTAAWAGVRGYARFMGADLAGIGPHDANGSLPWLWPVGCGPIVYRWDSDGRTTSYVVLAANQPGWLVSLAGVLGVALVLGLRAAGRAGDSPSVLLPGTLLLAWAALFASDVLLAQSRVMYLYHYFLPLLLGWAMAAWLAGWLARAPGALPRFARRVGGALVALALAVFVLQSPLALHHRLSDGACRTRAWLAGPAFCAHTVAKPSSTA